MRRVHLIALAALATVPATATAQGTTTGASQAPPAPVAATSGSGTGFTWATSWAGPAVQPRTIATAFGSVWAPDSASGGTISAINPANGSLIGTYTVPGLPAASSALGAGNFLWVAGKAGHSTLVTALNPSATPQFTFTAPVKASAVGQFYGGIALAYGAGKVWVADMTANRVYGISPTTGKLLRTIKVTAPRSVTVQGPRVWVSSTRTNDVTIYNASNGATVDRVAVPSDPTVMAPASGSMWVFTNAGVYGIGLKSLTRTRKVAVAIDGGSAWAAAVPTPSGIWASNYVAEVVLVNPAARATVINAMWSNNDIAGGLTVVGNSAWVADGSTYAFPLGSGVTQVTPAPAA